MLDLSDELQMAKIKQKMQHSTFECEKQHIIDEMEDILVSLKKFSYLKISIFMSIRTYS